MVPMGPIRLQNVLEANVQVMNLWLKLFPPLLLSNQLLTLPRPIPQAGGSWGAEDPRPQETYGQGVTGLEQDLQGGLDAMHG